MTLDALTQLLKNQQSLKKLYFNYQRLANIWTNKGYDLVFKFCACDCGHGSIRKDPDYVPPKPEPVAAAGDAVDNVEGAVGGAPAPAVDKKKKKKEKTNLKPKLNFNPQNVTGSYFGSSRQVNTNSDWLTQHNTYL